MRMLWKVLIVIVVLVLGGTYVLYALEYKGNYNVNLQYAVNVDDVGNVAVSNFEYTCTPTEYTQWWETGRGHVDDAANLVIYYELNISGETHTYMHRLAALYGESETINFQLTNLPVGDGSLKISVRSNTNALLVEHTYEVVIGG